MEAEPVDIPDPSNHAAAEEAILNSPEGAFSWMKSALSPLLSASANFAASTDIDVFLDQHFDDLPLRQPREPEGPLIDCSYSGCKRKIGPSSSQFNCSHCNKTYCSSHSGHPSFEVASTTEDEQVVYKRVCLACWTARPENQTGLGADRSWMNKFVHVRGEAMAKTMEHCNVIEGRLSEVVMHVNPVAYLWPS